MTGPDKEPGSPSPATLRLLPDYWVPLAGQKPHCVLLRTVQESPALAGHPVAIEGELGDSYLSKVKAGD